MKRMLLALALTGALTGLGACADSYYGGDNGPRHYRYYDHNPVSYEGYYDGYYGRVHDGYWGDGGVFYYSTGEGQPYVVDRGRHFRRDAYEGYRPFRGGIYVDVH